MLGLSWIQRDLRVFQCQLRKHLTDCSSFQKKSSRKSAFLILFPYCSHDFNLCWASACYATTCLPWLLRWSLQIHHPRQSQEISPDIFCFQLGLRKFSTSRSLACSCSWPISCFLEKLLSFYSKALLKKSFNLAHLVKREFLKGQAIIYSLQSCFPTMTPKTTDNWLLQSCSS